MTTKFLGQEGFRWFIGKVEDRDDPMLIGRVRVRIYNVHSEKKSLLPTAELPWAFVVNSITSASLDGIGVSPTGIAVGSTVIGFFMDGNDGNYPVLLGTLGALKDNLSASDVPTDAYGISSVNKTTDGSEPASAYGAKYPFNKVLKTEGGHIIEIDDTPNNERIHIYHKSGTYIEINNDGRTVRKSTDDDYEILMKNKLVEVRGSVGITAKGDITLSSEGSITIKASKAIYLNP
jgi:hypothetical protein